MHSFSLTALCPAVAGTRAPASYSRRTLRPAPQPAPRSGGAGRGLVLSITLPGDVRSAFVGRTAVSAALEANGLAPCVWPATHAVGELVAVSVRMSPGRELYVSLRHRGDAVRLLVWDQHPHHGDRDLATLCETRRRRALWLLAAVVDDWGGEWGACGSEPSQRGTKSWVVLPR
ncbi:ATP-binding protein [Streptomyces sp. NPDC059278]|uniref:ATP-binding protein n=1 Tax=Streptomyces sp. NPDC059278 TaxID=3346801 RepID=UPI0036B97222